MTPPSKPSWLAEVQVRPRGHPRPGHAARPDVDGCAASADRDARGLGEASRRAGRGLAGLPRRHPGASGRRGTGGPGGGSARGGRPPARSGTRPSPGCRSRAICSAPRGRRRAGRGPWSCIRRSITPSASRPGWRGRRTSRSACTWPVAATSRSARAASSGSTAGPAATTRPWTGSVAAIPGSRGWPRCSSTPSARSTSWRASPTSTRDRIGAIGHSLGAKEALYLAAFDHRVRATVSSEGGIGLADSNWDAPWYLGEAIRRPGFALEHGQVLALAAPRAFLLIGGDSADGDASWPYDRRGPARSGRSSAPPTRSACSTIARGTPSPQIAQARAYEWLDWFLRA